MVEESSHYTCCQCGELLPSSKFYRSFSSFYTSGFMPICKDCFTRKFLQYSSEYNSTQKAMQRMCMAFDIFYDDDLFDKCDSKDNFVLGDYFRKLNIKQCRGKTFEDTLNSGFMFTGERKRKKDNRVVLMDQYGNEQYTNKKKIKPSQTERWGFGFDVVDYEILDSHYKYLKNANPNCDSNQEIFISDLCYINMQKMKALRESRVDDYNKLTDSYRKSFNQAGLKTIQDESKNTDDCWSFLTDVVSQYTPEEWYKNKEKYKDHDGFGEYLDRFVRRPTNNIISGAQDRDFEFFVHDESGDMSDE